MSKLNCRMGTSADIPALHRLYAQCFPEDDDAYRNAFFQRIIPESMAFCGVLEGELVSALYLLSATAQKGNATVKAYYLYAGATFPAHRGHGYYKDLLSFASQWARSQGAAAIYLRPGNPSLFPYYTRFGYQPRITISRQATGGYHFQPDEPFLELFTEYCSDIHEGDKCTVLNLYSEDCRWLANATTTWIGE